MRNTYLEPIGAPIGAFKLLKNARIFHVFAYEYTSHLYEYLQFPIGNNGVPLFEYLKIALSVEASLL